MFNDSASQKYVSLNVSMSISSNPDQDISGQVVGPYSSGSSVAFSCESGGGNPAPSVSLRFCEEDLEGETTVDKNILKCEITVFSVVVVDLEREHSGAYLYCS